MTPRIIDQVRMVVELQGASPVAGTTPKEITDFERWLGLPLPEQLRSWLLFCNGARDLLPAGYYGIGKSRSDWDIDASWVLTTQWPEFRKLEWFPVADDGCGDFWVLPLRGDRHPVIFVDHEDDMDKGKYVAGSDLDHFLEMILERQILHHRDFDWSDRWPSDEEFVRARDPNIGPYEGVLPMWEADRMK